MHVDTGGELSADGNINMLPAASRVLFNQDKLKTLIVTLKKREKNVPLQNSFSSVSVVLPIGSEKKIQGCQDTYDDLVPSHIHGNTNTLSDKIKI